MRKIDTIVIGIPVYNEEARILDCLKSVYLALDEISIRFIVDVCFNGTTDRGQEIVKNNKRQFKNLRLSSSEKGKPKAIVKLIKKYKNCDAIIFFDADSKMDKDCIKNILKAYDSDDKLLCVTGNPIPLINTFFAKLINIRRVMPRSQIAPKSFPGFEKDRNYIHGRIFSLKKQSFEKILNSNLYNSKGDDTLISCLLIKFFGRNSFKIDYTVNVYYTPVQSLKGWWYKYSRIWAQMNNLSYCEPEIKEIIPYMGCKVDFKYVSEQRITIICMFIFERILFKTGRLIFQITTPFINYEWKRINETKENSA